MRYDIYHTTGKHNHSLLRAVVLLVMCLCLGISVKAEVVIGGNVYGGGNQGDVGQHTTVTLQEGFIEGSVFGGARMANVGGHAFVHIDGAHQTGNIVVKAVYGGNDISGTVHHGCNVELHGGRAVNVYGGGNGSYAYTDNPEWVAAHPEDADYYYEVGNVSPADNEQTGDNPESGEQGNSNSLGLTSLQALRMHRPHVESTLIYIKGYDHDNPLIVAGEVYCGGNSATLMKNGDRTQAKAILRIGQHAIIDGVFLGSNGVNMVAEEIVKKYASSDDMGNKYSNINLLQDEQIRYYMGGVAVGIRPRLQWDSELDEVYIGSLHYGGNKGSMTYSGMSTINVPREIVIYEKVVGGCNDACVQAGTYNAEYHGGLLEKGAPYNGMDNVKICLNVDAYLRPMELKLTYMDNNLFVENCEFVPDLLEEKIIETYDNQTLTSQTFVDANIYGGCYTSGHIKGDVVYRGVEGSAGIGVLQHDHNERDAHKRCVRKHGGKFKHTAHLIGSATVKLS